MESNNPLELIGAIPKFFTDFMASSVKNYIFYWQGVEMEEKLQNNQVEWIPNPDYKFYPEDYIYYPDDSAE